MASKSDIRKAEKLRAGLASTLLCALMLSHAGCFLNETLDPYYGRVVVPSSQDFRWSDGGLPQTFDPAFAAAPPDTDLVRAIFEGLTEYDPRTLTPIPAVATRWEPSNGGRVWTFYLRNDALWSNGEQVTASDFVRSWRRTLRIGELAPHTEMLANIEGALSESFPNKSSARTSNGLAQTEKQIPSERVDPVIKPADQAMTGKGTGDAERRGVEAAERRGVEAAERLGVEAISDQVLRVRLRRPDMNFPALVSHPVFRPVKLQDDSAISKLAASELVSNGAFSLAKTGSERVLLQRAQNYWDKEQVTLDHVEFIGARDAESALADYRFGKVDALTNAAFEPLAIKLLTPYEDFRRTTYGALTYYRFNTSRAPFDDVRVREALAVGIDRDRISADELGGATEPAKRFLPETVTSTQKPVVNKSEVLEKEYERARELLAEAGFADGHNFPKVRLLINRNEQQRVVAQAIAAMWHSVLNIETEIIIKNWDDYETSIRLGDYDVARRGMVMQTTDELTNMRTLFEESVSSVPAEAESEAALPAAANRQPATNEKNVLPRQPIETEAQALKDLSAMPVYFASSYSLVKPYVSGFDSNVLDAPSLKSVRISLNWKPAENTPPRLVR